MNCKPRHGRQEIVGDRLNLPPLRGLFRNRHFPTADVVGYRLALLRSFGGADCTGRQVSIRYFSSLSKIPSTLRRISRQKLRSSPSVEYPLRCRMKAIIAA